MRSTLFLTSSLVLYNSPVAHPRQRIDRTARHNRTADGAIIFASPKKNNISYETHTHTPRMYIARILINLNVCKCHCIHGKCSRERARLHSETHATFVVSVDERGSIVTVPRRTIFDKFLTPFKNPMRRLIRVWWNKQKKRRSRNDECACACETHFEEQCKRT